MSDNYIQFKNPDNKTMVYWIPPEQLNCNSCNIDESIAISKRSAEFTINDKNDKVVLKVPTYEYSYQVKDMSKFPDGVLVLKFMMSSEINEKKGQWQHGNSTVIKTHPVKLKQGFTHFLKPDNNYEANKFNIVDTLLSQQKRSTPPPTLHKSVECPVCKQTECPECKQKDCPVCKNCPVCKAGEKKCDTCKTCEICKPCDKCKDAEKCETCKSCKLSTGHKLFMALPWVLLVLLVAYLIYHMYDMKKNYIKK